MFTLESLFYVVLPVVILYALVNIVSLSGCKKRVNGNLRTNPTEQLISANEEIAHEICRLTALVIFSIPFMFACISCRGMLNERDVVILLIVYLIIAFIVFTFESLSKWINVNKQRQIFKTIFK